jgi:hypothetical protein
MLPTWNWTRVALMTVGTFDLLAWGALFLSDDAMASIHQSLGLGELPRSPVVGYLARTASIQYGLHGLLLWFVSTNVARYASLVPWLGGLKLVQALAIAAVDVTGDMPLWWTIAEPTCLAFAGIGILAGRLFDRRRERNRNETDSGS